MNLKRIIPILLIENNRLVKTVNFSKPRYVGDPINAVKIFSEKEADEIIEALEVEFDYDKRVELAHRFHKLVYDEQPYTFFYTRRSPFYWQKKLQGTKAQLTRPYLNVRAWYLSQ